MKGITNSSKVVTGIASLFLCTGVFAYTAPEYLVSDKYENVKILDGISGGRVVSSYGDMKVDPSALKGDKITNLSTQKSGIITGVRHHGTMDVMSSNGKNIRYQYVTFKVKRL